MAEHAATIEVFYSVLQPYLQDLKSVLSDTEFNTILNENNFEQSTTKRLVLKAQLKNQGWFSELKRPRSAENNQWTQKKQKREQDASPFLCGNQSFLCFGEGHFFRDNSTFIVLLEQLNAPAIVSLHPRRFGKSVFLTMLGEYYDLKNKNRLQELFGALAIGKRMTPNAGTFLVLSLVFGGLDVSNFDNFQHSFRMTNNSSLNLFLNKYYSELEAPLVDPKDDFVSNFMAVCFAVHQKGFKMYVTIDEYDSSLMASLASRMQLVDQDSKLQDSKEIENQFKRFFTVLKDADKYGVRAFITGVSPLCLTEFTSGWNHAARVSDDPDFADMYGFTPEDVTRGIHLIQPELPSDVADMLLKYCDRYDGYKFHSLQTTRLYNPGRIMYFLQQVSKLWKRKPEIQGKELVDYLVDFQDDTQTRPAASTLQFVYTSKAAKSVLQDLLGAEDVELDYKVDSSFSLETIGENTQSLISYMFYSGALTYSKNNKLIIPNEDAKVDYVEAALKLHEISTTLQSQIKSAIRCLLDKSDITELCQAFESGYRNERGVRDTIQGEISFQEVVFNRLLVCRNPLDKVYSEYIVNSVDRESSHRAYKKSIDVVYQDTKRQRRYCFELKNIRVQDLKIGQDLESQHDALKGLSNGIADMSEQEVLELELKDPKLCPLWFREYWGRNVGEFIQKVKQEVITKYQPELIKDNSKDGEATAWVVVRVGLGRVLAKRAF